jgi:hypothetical protein
VTIAAQSFDEVGLVPTPKGGHVNRPDCGPLIEVLGVFKSNADEAVRC